LRTALLVFAAVLLGALAGCKPPVAEPEKLRPGCELLTVDFSQGQTLRYKFVSSRDIEVNWEPSKTPSKAGKAGVDKTAESMEMIVAYAPVKIDPYGLTKIEATCESVKVTRSKQPTARAARTDAVDSLRGKTFTLTVGPTGKIEDYSKLDELIRQIGEKAFRPDTSRGRVKEPDMIGDFIVTQWFLWDSIARIENASEGVCPGQNWTSQIWIPSPMVMRKARDITYTLAEFRSTDKGKLAVIRSSYSPAESVPSGWPVPYTGSFQMSGTFGFLRGYKLVSLEGKGQELFNATYGRVEQYDQQYRMQLDAGLPFALGGVQPQITIDQKLTMQLLE